MRIDRQAVLEKTGGHCGYCGKELGGKFHVDHIYPKHRGGKDDITNLIAACQRCNIRKATFTVEGFREEIEAQPDRLERDSAAFRLALAFGVIEIKKEYGTVQFFHEYYKDQLDSGQKT